MAIKLSHKYDWESFPKYIIDLSKIQVPSQIVACFKKHNIDKYVYCIMFKGIIIKFGMSAPKSYTREWGERVYRQIGHCSSWGDDVRLNGSSGSDWLIIERDFKYLHEIDLDHKYMKVIIWDVTNYKFQGFDPAKEVESMESEKINNYLYEYNEKPIGNLHDEANKLKRTFVSKQIYNNCFEEVPA